MHNGAVRKFLPLFFLTRDFLPLSIFSKAKSFHEWIKSSARCKQNMDITWKSSSNISGCRQNSSPGDSPRSDIMTPSWFMNFICFGCFERFQKFFLNGNARLNVWIQNSNMREKSIFFCLWRWEVTLNFSLTENTCQVFYYLIIKRRSTTSSPRSTCWTTGS